MILITSPKPRNDQTEAVQIAAFRSWRRAFPNAAILLYGDVASWKEEMDSLVMQAAGPLIKGMAGGEVIRDMFQDASKRGVGQLLLYLNSDILLDDSAAYVVAKIQNRPGPWLGSARRWCLPRWSEVTPTSESEWRGFFSRAERSGRWGEACALDMFLFCGLSFERMPPFFIGHRGWDNWMVYHARAQRIPVIDMSDEMRVIHCDHDYSYAKGNTTPGRRDGPLEEANLKMLGGENRLFHLGHATHELRYGKVTQCRGWGPIQRNLEIWQMNHPGQSWWWRPIRRLFHPLLKLWQSSTTRAEDWNRQGKTISNL
jgi:hypothetical protein